MRVLISLLLTLLAGVAPLPLSAQVVEEGAPLEIVAKPKVAPPGTPVLVSGRVQVDGKHLGMKLDVSRGEETPLVFAVQTTPVGTFSFTFKQTQQAGSYRVRVLAPDGKGRAETRFLIGSTGAVWGALDSALGKVAELATSGLSAAKTRALAAPASGERTEFLARLQQLDAQRAAVMGQAQEAFRDFRQGLAQAGIPEAALFGETPGKGPMNELLDWADESARKSDELKAKLAAAGKDDSICDTIQACLEGLNATSLAFSFTTKATGMLLNVALDKGIPLLVAKLSDDAAVQFKWTAVAKQSAAVCRGTTDALSGVIGFLNDAATYATERLLRKFCGQYQGPVTATMDAALDSSHGQVWWKYSTTLQGRLTLRFPRNSPAGQPVRMTGEFEGNATAFSFWADPTREGYLPDGGFVVLRKALPAPAGVDATASPADFGMMARAMTPFSFNIPVEALMEDGKVVLKFLPARTDFLPEIAQHRYLLVYTTAVVPVPLFKVFKFPFQNAAFVLSRVMRNPADLVVSGPAGKATIHQNFNRTHTSDKGDIRITWTATVQAEQKF